MPASKLCSSASTSASTLVPAPKLCSSARVHGQASGSFVRALLKHQWLRHDQTRSKRKHAAIIIIRNHGRGERKQRVINLDFPKRLVRNARKTNPRLSGKLAGSIDHPGRTSWHPSDTFAPPTTGLCEDKVLKPAVQFHFPIFATRRESLLCKHISKTKMFVLEIRPGC